MEFKKYIATFTGKNISSPVPGEHHFVGLCLLKVLMDKIGDVSRIKYVNPDGSKNSKSKKIILKNGEEDKDIVLYDISIKAVKGNKLSGVEVKYSKGNSIKYTASQLDHLYPKDLNRNPVPGFKGFIAITNVNGEEECKILFISAKNFYKHFGEDFEKIKKISKNSDSYTQKYISKTSKFHLDKFCGWEEITQDGFLKLMLPEAYSS